MRREGGHWPMSRGHWAMRVLIVLQGHARRAMRHGNRPLGYEGMLEG